MKPAECPGFRWGATEEKDSRDIPVRSSFFAETETFRLSVKRRSDTQALGYAEPTTLSRAATIFSIRFESSSFVQDILICIEIARLMMRSD